MCKNRTRNLPVVNRHDVEVDKPGQWVLVHGVNVGEVSDGEEENGGVFGDGTVAHTTRVNLLLGLLSNLGKAKKRFIHSYVQRNFFTPTLLLVNLILWQNSKVLGLVPVNDFVIIACWTLNCCQIW